MGGHIHTDAMHLIVYALAIGVIFHTARMGGGWLASKNVPGGATMKAFATFN